MYSSRIDLPAHKAKAILIIHWHLPGNSRTIRTVLEIPVHPGLESGTMTQALLPIPVLPVLSFFQPQPQLMSSLIDL